MRETSAERWRYKFIVVGLYQPFSCPPYLRILQVVVVSPYNAKAKSYSFPMGKQNKDETRLQCAAREVRWQHVALRHKKRNRGMRSHPPPPLFASTGV